MNAPGFKTRKDRVTLIICENAAGMLMKPGLIYKSANLRALWNKNKHFPCLLDAQFQGLDCECPDIKLVSSMLRPQVEENLHKKGMEFHVLLLMDNAGGHPVDLYNEGVQIEFLPPNTTSLLQPMDQLDWELSSAIS